MGRSAVIGTGEDCDVRVRDAPYVSARHARVWTDDDGVVWVEDLGSTNGTWIQRAGRPGAALELVYVKARFNKGDTLWLSQRTPIPWD